MSEEEPKYAKGDRAAIVEGRQGKGMRGEIFWTGENKYGAGFRYGLRGDNGETYWVDESHLGAEDAVPEPPTTPERPVLQKGSQVKITGGRDGAGKEGEIFWTGESRYGKGMRYGVRVGEETHWADEAHVELIAPPADKPAGGGNGDTESIPAEAVAPSLDGPPPLDDVPLPDDDDFAPSERFDEDPGDYAFDDEDPPF